ncbi:hypothetical protein [Bdellovibrio sp. HCB2-146]|uniref:hypothetical protein n=1 Tax=Bdellovibrio sp. HCB2-146 TaxID=3394362 RepID=UPI0039BC4889
MAVPLKNLIDKIRGVKHKAPVPPPVEQKQEEASIDKKIRDSWNKRDGELSEVYDSEGHRVRINHY